MSSQESFSIVIPIAEGDVDLVPKTLPSWVSLGSSDVVLCVDRPASEGLLLAIENLARRNPKIRVLEVPENPEWKFRLAYIRREGLRAAKFDKILTGDIDIVVNDNCLRAVGMVGDKNVGLVSISKRRGAGTLGESIRNASKMVVKVLRGRRFFTGLYALYRPYWLDSEDQEQVKGAQHPERGGSPGGGFTYLGEDVILRNAMATKHTILYLNDVGGTDLRTSLEDRAPIQAKLGARYYRDEKAMGYVLAQSILYARGTMLGTYADLILREKGTASILRAYVAALGFLVELAESHVLRRLGLMKGTGYRRAKSGIQ